MADDDDSAQRLVRLWADWEQRDPSGLVWTFRHDADRPEEVVPGAVVLAGPDQDVDLAEVVAVIDEPFRSVVLLRRLGAPGLVP